MPFVSIKHDHHPGSCSLENTNALGLSTHLGLSEKRRDVVVAFSPVVLLVERFRYLQALLGVVRDAVRRGKFGFHRSVASWLVRQRFQLEVFPVSVQLLGELGIWNLLGTCDTKSSLSRSRQKVEL